MNNNQQSNVIWPNVPSSVTTAYDYNIGGHLQVISVPSSSSAATASSPFTFSQSALGSANNIFVNSTRSVGNSISDNNGNCTASADNSSPLELISSSNSSSLDHLRGHINQHHQGQSLTSANQLQSNIRNHHHLQQSASSFLYGTNAAYNVNAGGGKTAIAISGNGFPYDYVLQPPLPLDVSENNFLQSPNFNAVNLSAAYFPADASHWSGMFNNPTEFEFSLVDNLPFRHPTDNFMPPHPLGPTSHFPNRFGHFEPMGPTPPKRRTGGRRPKEEESKLPPEEEEKRRLRRLRNKEAAARCRKRRLDQMNTLEIKVTELQTIQNRLENDLDRLLQEKQELEFILKSHESICQCRDIKPFTSVMKSEFVMSNASKSDQDDDSMMEDDDKMDDDPTLSSAIVVVTSARGGKLTMTQAKDCMANDGMLSRPSTLSLPSEPIMTPSFDQTPSRVFDLFSQPTGLTPMTLGGGFTPLLSVTNSLAGHLLPSLETPSVTESKPLPSNSNFTKL